MHADLDALVTALYVRVDDLLPKRRGRGHPPRITDAELIALAVAQMFLAIPNDRKFLAIARWRLGHLFPYLPKQPGYNKRLRKLAPTIARVITQLAVGSPSFCDNLRLLDSTPVPCGQSRETARRSELAGHAAYGWCKSHSRYFWGFRLYLLCAPDGMPIAFELAPANAPERVVATEMLERLDLDGYTVMADKGFAGEEFEQIMAALGAHFLRPDRRDEPDRHGSLGPVRQWIESVFWTCKGQLTLEAHGGRTIEGLCTRVALRLLALATGLIHNQHIGDPGWARTSEVAPVWTLEVAPSPSDRSPTVRCSSSSSGRGRRGWVPGWRRSSRSGAIVIERGCRSGRWRPVMGFIVGR